jgi:fructosamine-3-kinase
LKAITLRILAGMKQLLSEIAEQEDLKISNIRPLSGGSINAVYQCKTRRGETVIKINQSDLYPAMFRKEVDGLEALRKSDTFLIPNIIATGEVANYAYLILEYLPPAPAKNWSHFGQQLAQLHQHTTANFGFPEWNYIGRLRQYNDYRESATEFLITQRLEPQFRLASENGFVFQQTDKLYQVVKSLIPEVKPALIHGDLWSGNYLSTEKGFALIDPAVSYGLREMDLAMMQLFGGFPAAVFESYEHHFPTSLEFDERIPIYQLYYLLVHLNLFGVGYYQQCQRIIERYA